MESKDEDEDFNRKYDAIAIKWDEEGNASVSEQPDSEGDPSLSLGIEPITTAGEKLKFAISLETEDDRQTLLLQPDAETHYRDILPWLSILSLAGARTFCNPDELVLFADPRGGWVDLYFTHLPASISDHEYSELIWSQYLSIDLWLKETATGVVLARLRLTRPEDRTDSIE